MFIMRKLSKQDFKDWYSNLWLDYQVYGPFDRLVINDMGDSLDGYNKNTTSIWTYIRSKHGK